MSSERWLERNDVVLFNYYTRTEGFYHILELLEDADRIGYLGDAK